jgi:hypothetical protein
MLAPPAPAPPSPALTYRQCRESPQYQKWARWQTFRRCYWWERKIMEGRRHG